MNGRMNAHVKWRLRCTAPPPLPQPITSPAAPRTIVADGTTGDTDAHELHMYMMNMNTRMNALIRNGINFKERKRELGNGNLLGTIGCYNRYFDDIEN